MPENRTRNKEKTMDMRTDLGRGLVLDNPFMTASGTCGYGSEYSEITHPGKWGAMVLKTVTLSPRQGNPPPRCCEADSGMLNSIGLANTGIDSFLSDKLPHFGRSFPGAKAVASIAGESVSEFASLAGKIGQGSIACAIELNFSCPNVSRGGIHFGADTASASDAVRECRKATSLPLWVKISPAVQDPVKIAAACIEAGADAVTAANTLPAMMIDIWKKKPLLGNITGGLSGPALFPVSLRIAYMIAKALPGITLIGCGGIDNAEKAIQFILAGCSAVEVGTAVFRNPAVLDELLAGTLQWMDRCGFTAVKDFKGLALKS